MTTEIKFSNDKNHDYGFVDISIFEDKGENQPWNKAEITLQVPYDDSNAVMRERANDELASFLKNALNQLESLKSK